MRMSGVYRKSASRCLSKRKMAVGMQRIGQNQHALQFKFVQLPLRLDCSADFCRKGNLCNPRAQALGIVAHLGYEFHDAKSFPATVPRSVLPLQIRVSMTFEIRPYSADFHWRNRVSKPVSASCKSSGSKLNPILSC